MSKATNHLMSLISTLIISMHILDVKCSTITVGYWFEPSMYTYTGCQMLHYHYRILIWTKHAFTGCQVLGITVGYRFKQIYQACIHWMSSILHHCRILTGTKYAYTGRLVLHISASILNNTLILDVKSSALHDWRIFIWTDSVNIHRMSSALLKDIDLNRFSKNALNVMCPTSL